LPAGLATKGVQALGAAPRVASMLGGFAGGTALTGAYTDDRKQQLAQGGIAALQSATHGLPYAARVLPAAVGGIASGMETYSSGAPLPLAAGMGVLNTVLPFLGKPTLDPHTAMRGPATGGPIIPDEIIPPTGKWNRAKPIRSDITIEELAQPQLRNGAETERGPITPVHSAQGDNLPIDRMLYNVQLADEAARVPFTLKDGKIVPTWESRQLLPEHTASQLEPTAAEAAVATLQPLEKPDIHDIRPAIRIGENVHVGEKFDTHQNILDRYLNTNLEDVDALFNFDTKENPNFFRASNRDITREQLKEMYGVKDSQGLRKLQKANEISPEPVRPTPTEPVRTIAEPVAEPE